MDTHKHTNNTHGCLRIRSRERERDTDPTVRSKSNRSPGWSGASTQIIFRFCRGIRTENNTFRVRVPSQPDRTVCGSALMTGRNGTDYWNSGRLADTEGTFSTVPELEMTGCYWLTRPPGQTHTRPHRQTHTYRYTQRHTCTHTHEHMNTCFLMTMFLMFVLRPLPLLIWTCPD